MSFFAFPTLRFGVEVSSGDVDGDAFGELISGPGPSGAFSSQLRGFDVDGGSVATKPAINSLVFPGARYGLTVTSGDLDGDGYGEIVAGAGPDPAFGSRIRSFDFATGRLAELPALSLDAFGLSYGARVSAGNLGF